MIEGCCCCWPRAVRAKREAKRGRGPRGETTSRREKGRVALFSYRLGANVLQLKVEFCTLVPRLWLRSRAKWRDETRDKFVGTREARARRERDSQGQRGGVCRFASLNSRCKFKRYTEQLSLLLFNSHTLKPLSRRSAYSSNALLASTTRTTFHRHPLYMDYPPSI